MGESTETYRRRRLVALAALACVVLACLLAVRSCGGDDGADAAAGDAAAAAAAAASDTALPGGGRRIFPDYRVVAFYGAPQDRPARRARHRHARRGRGAPAPGRAPLRARTRPVLPAFELISTIAAEAPGDDGMYRIHQSDEVIGRYLAPHAGPRRCSCSTSSPAAATSSARHGAWSAGCSEPDVGIALDPEWHVGPGEVPGKVIGSVTADEVNAVSAYVSAFVSDHDLPDKLFVVHQFTSSMIQSKERVRQRLGLAITMNVDGFGDRSNKISKYDQFTSELTRFHNGLKLFYEEDTNLMSPRQVLGLRPPPDLVVYE